MDVQSYCPKYEIIAVPDITTFSPSYSETVNRVLFDFQGSFVMLSRKSHPDSVLRLFKDIRDVSVELVVESPQGDKFLTPWHTNDPVIRATEIVTDFADMDTPFDFVDGTSFSARPHVVDLRKFWSVDVDRFDAEDLHHFFNSFFSGFRPTQSLTLVGEAPLVPLIILAFLLYGVVDELQYERERGTDTVQIF